MGINIFPFNLMHQVKWKNIDPHPFASIPIAHLSDKSWYMSEHRVMRYMACNPHLVLRGSCGPCSDGNPHCRAAYQCSRVYLNKRGISQRGTSRYHRILILAGSFGIGLIPHGQPASLGFPESKSVGRETPKIAQLLRQDSNTSIFNVLLEL